VTYFDSSKEKGSASFLKILQEKKLEIRFFYGRNRLSGGLAEP